jgi:hypothetical protein
MLPKKPPWRAAFSRAALPDDKNAGIVMLIYLQKGPSSTWLDSEVIPRPAFNAADSEFCATPVNTLLSCKSTEIPYGLFVSIFF